MIDKKIIRYASPTLAGIKTGNLFKIYLSEIDSLNDIIFYYNTIFNPHNIYLYNLYTTDFYALIYIFRISYLKNDLSDDRIKNFLIMYGYDYTNISSILLSLKNSFYKNKCTPHEVGVFLGYPLEDVLAFIINKGKNYKLSGCWKVYGDDIKYKIIFDNYKKCRNNNFNLYNMGFSLESLVYQT